MRHFNVYAPFVPEAPGGIQRLVCQERQPLQIINSSDPTVRYTPAWICLSEDQRMCMYNSVLQVVEGFNTTYCFVLLAWLHICERSLCNQFIIPQ